MKIKDLLDNKTIDKNENYLAISSLLSMSIPEIKLNKEKEISKKELKNYLKIKKQLEKGETIQYILKKANFYGNDFYINKNVLVPRPETETLVEITNNLIKETIKNKEINILDIGTGSGVIAITLNLLNKNSKITATDISKKALKVAKINNKKNKTNVKFIKTNLYEKNNQKYDVIISNPPYIDKNDNKIEEKVKNNEPSLALFAKDEGLFYYKEILKNINKIINEKHIIAFEIGEGQGNKIKEIIEKYLPNDNVTIKKDYNGFERYIFITSKK